MKKLAVLFFGGIMIVGAVSAREIQITVYNNDLGLVRDLREMEFETGRLAGIGIWPFALSIILFSLFIDHIGYKTAMLFALDLELRNNGCTFFRECM